MSDQEKATPVAPAPAATVKLVRDTDHGIEVFMMKRNIKGSFSGAFVFPGGKVDESDASESLLPFIHGLDDVQASALLGIPKGGISYWVACIRECFEEAGILLAQDTDGNDIDLSQHAEIFAQYRRQLNDGEDVLAQMCERFDLRLNLDRLAYSAHWVTPTIEKRRYNTRFFVAATPKNQVADHDGAELVNSLWITPQKALDLGKSGEILIIMPTIKNLEAMLPYDSCEELLQADKQISANGGIPTIQPKFIKVDGKFKVYMPGDEGYEAITEEVERYGN